MPIFPPPPLPPTKLGRHRQLSPFAGVHVSPLCLGGMSIGDKWGKLGFGAMDKEASFKLLDAFFDAGGNFIDTASNYQSESSEEFIGEWAEKRGIRDQLVLATKFSSGYKQGKPEIIQQTHYVGNSAKSLHMSIEASLKKLRTSYVDILYLHWWDYTTSIEEVMNHLHALVMQGKVLYLGISDTPAWIVAKANYYARSNGKTPFVIYQGAWSILERDFEREIIPMARAEGMALAPWNVLGGGKIRSDEEEAKRKESGENGRTLMSPAWERSPDERKVCLSLEKVAQEVGAKSITAVAIAYVMQKTRFVFPVIGGRKVEHFQSNLEALDITLSPEQMASLESALPFDKGFPYKYFGDETVYNVMYTALGHFDRWPLAEPIKAKPQGQ